VNAVGGWRSALRNRVERLSGAPVERDLRPYAALLRRVDGVDVSGLTDVCLRDRAAAARARAQAGQDLSALLPEVYALAREACARALGLRPFDVQVMAAAALHQGKLAQLATGEGKTLVAVLPAALNAMAGGGVHVLTANDYLAERDAAWMGPAFGLLGLSAAAVVTGMDRRARQAAYAADVTYLTAREAGFDYLRDHTVLDPADLVQRPYRFAIVDEADFILIDEARVPLVIAGETPQPPVDHVRMARLARELRGGLDYVADAPARNVSLTDEGFRRAERLLGCGPLHETSQRLVLASLHVALHAETLLLRDRDYIVRGGRVELVDEFTGRVADNRRWPHGIQPAVEAKEGVEVRPEGVVLGSIPLQHLVRLWPRVAGMTATAVPAAEEFHALYGLTTVVFPPNRPCRRVDEPDVVFTSREAKTSALVDAIARAHATGRPVLVGTASVAESESLFRALRDRGVKGRVLNARHDAREARIVSRAGVPGAVTISTNMAGRGTDIVLGGGDAALRERAAALGGLYVIGTNRHESRRIDEQLRGRAGRQGDPGSSRFFISLEDDLVRRYGVMALIPPARRPRPRSGPVEDPIVRREIARAQRIIEGQNFEIRRTLWRYSSMVEEQRAMVSAMRQDLLLGRDGFTACAEDAPALHAELERAVGPGELGRVERRLTLLLLDRRWSDHLAAVDDIREGIYLQRVGGRDPLAEFQRQIIDAFAAAMDGLREDVVEAFGRLEAEGGRIDLERIGLRVPASTWTYLVNDDPFKSAWFRLIGPGGFGHAVGATFLAVVYWPLSFALAAAVMVRRRLRRRAGRHDRT